MGIIQRQALRNTIINFVGAALGGVTRMFLPIVVPGKAEFGLLSLLDSISGVFVTVFSLGYNTILVQIFPKYRNDKNGHFGFLMFGIFLSLIGIGISFIIFYLFGHNLMNDDADLVLYERFYLLIFPMIFFRILFHNVEGYMKMLYQTFIGTFLDTFLSRFFILIAIILYGFMLFTFDQFVFLYAFAFCIPGIVVLMFAFVKTKKITLPKKEIFSNNQTKKIQEYIAFGMLIGASGSIVIYVDQLMVTKMVSLEMMGVYTLFFFAARFIMIPGTSILRIAQVILADSWKQNDMKNIDEVYTKSCINQLLLAAYLLGTGWVLLDPVLQLHPKFADYQPYQYLFLILGIGILIEMATGVNTAVIATSPIYKYNMYFNVVLAILVIVLNYFLINEYVLTGAALASVIAMTVVNFFRWLLLYKKYNLQPFKTKFFKALLFALIFLTASLFINYEASPIVKIVLNLILFTLLFWIPTIYFNLSDDVNNWLKKMKAKFF